MESIAGTGNFVEIHEAANKMIKCLRIFNDPKEAAREIEIEFVDGTELSIEIHSQTTVLTRLCNLEGGDFLVTYESAVGPAQVR